MKRELLIKKCMKCGAMVKVIEDCKCGEDCGIKCCGEKMAVLEPNSVDAAIEKHVPTYEVKDGKIFVKVNLRKFLMLYSVIKFLVIFLYEFIRIFLTVWLPPIVSFTKGTTCLLIYSLLVIFIKKSASLLT